MSWRITNDSIGKKLFWRNGVISEMPLYHGRTRYLLSDADMFPSHNQWILFITISLNCPSLALNLPNTASNIVSSLLLLLLILAYHS